MPSRKGDSSEQPPTTSSTSTVLSYRNSTHRSNWTFADVDALHRQRCTANEMFCRKFRQKLLEHGVDAKEVERMCSTLFDESDERVLCNGVVESAREFADKFTPPLWPSTKATAYELFRRFFCRNSVMEYSPKNIMITAFYAATKIDDFYVPIGKFVSNMSSGTSIDNERFIRSLEPVLLASLDYNLVVYLPYRPLDGHLLMAKALLPQERQTLDVLRSGAYRFLENVMMSDALLLYAPSQVALAALLAAARKAANEATLLAYLRVLLANHTTPECTGDDADALLSTRTSALCARLDAIIELVDAAAHCVDEASERRVDVKSQCYVPVYDEYLALTREPTGDASGRFSDSDDAF